MIDLDNTLGDRERAVHAWIDDFVLQQQLGPEAAAWMRVLDNDGYSSRLEVMTAVRARFDLPDTVSELLGAYQRRIVDLTRPVRGAHECLRGLRANGWKIAIVTNGSTKQQNAKIDHLGFREMVDAVVVSETLGIKKPDAAIFHAAATACDVNSFEGHWMVGDSPHHDIEGGSAIGLSTAWIPRGRAWPKALPAPTITVDDLATLPDQLAGEHVGG